MIFHSSRAPLESAGASCSTQKTVKYSRFGWKGRHPSQETTWKVSRAPAFLVWYLGPINGSQNASQNYCISFGWMCDPKEQIPQWERNGQDLLNGAFYWRNSFEPKTSELFFYFIFLFF